MSANETIADIIAKKRRIAKSIRDEASNGDYWDKQKANEEAEEYEWDADDIEAAYKRAMGEVREAIELLINLDNWCCTGTDEDKSGCMEYGCIYQENDSEDCPWKKIRAVLDATRRI